jgi:hypothetical protein|tara:strand:+ start:11514 stop:11804 length:291 start_codon:yes stop_codon:yes gene_type:complete
MIAKEFLNDRSDHHIRYLFKSFLRTLEEMQKVHEINFEKLYDNLPNDCHGLIEMADYFDEDHYEVYRKKILDIGNSVLRDYNNELENLTVEFRFKQ